MHEVLYFSCSCSSAQDQHVGWGLQVTGACRANEILKLELGADAGARYTGMKQVTRRGENLRSVGYVGEVRGVARSQEILAGIGQRRSLGLVSSTSLSTTRPPCPHSTLQDRSRHQTSTIPDSKYCHLHSRKWQSDSSIVSASPSILPQSRLHH